MKNKEDDQFWNETKALKKKKVGLMFKNKQHESDNPKKKKSVPLLWGGVLVALVMLYAIVSMTGNKPIPAVAEIEKLSEKDMKPEIIHEYLTQTQGLEEEIGQFLNNISYANEDVTAEDLRNKKKELIHFENRAKTNVTYLVPLQNYYVGQVSLVKKIIDLMIERKEGKGYFYDVHIREAKKDYNRYVMVEQDVIIALIEKAGISYQVQSDGSLYYEIEGIK